MEDARAGWDDAAAVILPIPYEATTSWRPGTREGPAAILEASRYVEWYDEELDREPIDIGICTLPAVELSAAGPAPAIRELRALYDDLLDAAGDRLVIGLGGEHSISSAPATAWIDRLDDEVSILQFDAHADLREEYHGTPWNHACVMRRILDRTERIVSVGVRALTIEERDVIRERDVTTVFAHQMREDGWVERVLDALGDDVYITFDVDFFDPALVPATGTPEPGGGDWWDAMRLLRAVFTECRVVGADVVELAPAPGMHASAFTVAKLVYKMIGFWSEGRGG
ncbi:MAG: agmatinase [Gemmatimonadota bacterium]|nr:agmatinase [Gemmatimonadota bacterium]